MLSDLEHLITLQRIQNAAVAARARIDELPSRIAQLDARLGETSEEVVRAQQRFDDLKADRQAREKELAAVQTRLSRFKEQLMEVKTNREYQAMQVEIAGGEAEVRRLEDLILERMLEGDELGAEVERAQRQLTEERAAIEAERAGLEREQVELGQRVEQLEAERQRQVGVLTPPLLALFEQLARHRNGIAVVEARDGRCASCQVRLRPQLFNNVRLNDSLIQCESCQRILYFDTRPDAPERGADG
jgi:predicted  nucleic acid-binding Zn-ribbon protein